MSTITYKCPCCGAALSYGGLANKLQCASCGNAFELSDIQGLQDTGNHDHIDFEMPEEYFSADELESVSNYVCQNCGAQLMTEATTTATVCPYCGNSAILPEQIEGGVKPQLVVPFRISKEEAIRQFEEYFNGKKLLPNIFKTTRNRIADMRKLYVPYWLFDCSVYADMAFNAEKRHVSRQGDWEVTRTEHYLVRRAGTLSFERVPVDGSQKLDNKITETLEPYDIDAAVPFAPAVLSGAMADRADVDAAACEHRAAERMAESTEDAMRGTVNGYSSVSVRARSIQSQHSQVTPALMPVWLITTQKEENGQKKIYTFAINGQTGELTCDVPYDKGKATKWFLGIFAACFAAGYGILRLLMGSGVLG